MIVEVWCFEDTDESEQPEVMGVLGWRYALVDDVDEKKASFDALVMGDADYRIKAIPLSDEINSSWTQADFDARSGEIAATEMGCIWRHVRQHRLAQR